MKDSITRCVCLIWTAPSLMCRDEPSISPRVYTCPASDLFRSNISVVLFFSSPVEIEFQQRKPNQSCSAVLCSWQNSASALIAFVGMFCQSKTQKHINITSMTIYIYYICLSLSLYLEKKKKKELSVVRRTKELAAARAVESTQEEERKKKIKIGRPKTEEKRERPLQSDQQTLSEVYATREKQELCTRAVQFDSYADWRLTTRNAYATSLAPNEVKQRCCFPSADALWLCYILMFLPNPHHVAPAHFTRDKKPPPKKIKNKRKKRTNHIL